MQVNQGMQLVQQELLADSGSADTIWISVITFSSTASQTKLMSIRDFIPPQLTAGGMTSLGAALHLLNESLDHDLVANEDNNPLVLLLTDGSPTDSWMAEALRLRSRTKNINVVALAIGNEVNFSILDQIANTVEYAVDDNVFQFFTTQLNAIKDASSLHPAQRPHIFVSHSHRDDTFTTRLVADLRAAGADVWVDLNNVTLDNFMKRIDQGLAASDWFVLVLTPDALTSEYAMEETYTALNMVKQKRMRSVIPILAAPCAPLTISPMIDALNRYDATRDYHAALRGLLAAVGLGTA